MRASFVIGFHTARIDNLLQTLRFLLADHKDVFTDSYLSLVCQDNCDDLPPQQLEELESLREQSHRSCIINLSLPCMQLPYVTNLGMEDAETEKVFILESDRILPAGYFAAVLDELKPGVQITCRNMKKLAKPATDDEIRAGAFEYADEHRSDTNEIGMRNVWSGNTALCKSDFIKAGRMDESYHGYGWADSDMTSAMEAVGVRSVFRDELELHLWHPPATYGEGDQKQMFIDNGLRYCKKWNKGLPDFLRAEIAKRKKVML